MKYLCDKSIKIADVLDQYELPTETYIIYFSLR